MRLLKVHHSEREGAFYAKSSGAVCRVKVSADGPRTTCSRSTPPRSNHSLRFAAAGSVGAEDSRRTWAGRCRRCRFGLFWNWLRPMGKRQRDCIDCGTPVKYLGRSRIIDTVADLLCCRVFRSWPVGWAASGQAAHTPGPAFGADTHWRARRGDNLDVFFRHGRFIPTSVSMPAMIEAASGRPSHGSDAELISALLHRCVTDQTLCGGLTPQQDSQTATTTQVDTLNTVHISDSSHSRTR